MKVQIDKAPDGSYYCTHVDGYPRAITEEDDPFLMVSEILLGPGVDFDAKLAADFVGGWLLTLIEQGLSPLTRYDRIILRETA